MKRYFGKMLSVIFIITFIVYFYNNQEKFESLKEVSIFSLIIIAIFKITTTFINGLFIKVVLKAFDKNISILETFYLSTLSAIGNYFLPMQGGASIRALYLKRKFKLSYANFISTLSGNYIISFLINSLIGIISLLYIHIKFNQYSPILYLFFIGLFIVSLLLSTVGLPAFIFKINLRLKLLNNILKILDNIVNGWNRIIKDKKLLLKLLTITLLNFLISLIVTYVEFKTLSLEPTLTKLALYSTISAMSLLISITPGSIGIKEAILIFSSAIIGITNTEVLQIAVIDRGVVFFVLLLMYIVIKLIRSKYDPIANYNEKKIS